MIEDKVITISVAELVNTFASLHKQAEGIKEACMIMAEEGIAEKTEGVEVVNDIATALAEEIESLIDQLSKAEGNTHIIAIDPDIQNTIKGGGTMKEPTEEDPIYRMAEETQRELQRQADEAQEAIERAGVWKPEL